MKKIIFGMLLVCSSSFAADRNYQFTASGPDLASLQTLKNCIDYSTCQFVSSSIAGKEGAYRFHTFVILTESEFKTVITNCKPDSQPFKVALYDADTKAPIPLVHAAETSTQADVWPGEKISVETLRKKLETLRNFVEGKTAQSTKLPDMRPVENNTLSAETLRKNFETLRSFVEANRIDDAFQFVREAYEIPLEDYKLALSNTVAPNVCVTDHEKKTVSIGKEWVADACGLVRALRHEAEHIHQIAHLNKCNGISTFLDHRERERSAYLNDILNIRKFCTDPEAAARQEEAALGQFFESYTTAK